MSEDVRETTRFTKGPWYIAVTAKPHAVCAGTSSEPRLIAKCRDAGRLPTKEDEANAQLIAAAPDLYAKAERLLTLLSSYAFAIIPVIPSGQGYDAYCDAYNALETALALAREGIPNRK